MDQYDLMFGEECHDNLQDTYDASSYLGVGQSPPRPLICENSFSHSLLRSAPCSQDDGEPEITIIQAPSAMLKLMLLNFGTVCQAGIGVAQGSHSCLRLSDWLDKVGSPATISHTARQEGVW